MVVGRWLVPNGYIMFAEWVYVKALQQNRCKENYKPATINECGRLHPGSEMCVVGIFRNLFVSSNFLLHFFFVIKY